MNTTNETLPTISPLPLAIARTDLLNIRASVQYLIMMALIFFVNISFIPYRAAHADTAAVITNPVKWHPGHYYSLMGHGKNSKWYMSEVYRELKATPALRGVHIRYSWEELETDEGEYNFSAIAKRLSELSAINKRLIIMLETRSFDLSDKLVPAYLNTSKYEGGAYVYGSVNKKGQKGYNIKLWNPLVHDRLVELMRALGDRFNSNPYFEGIGLTETAMGQSSIPLSSIQVNKYYENMLSLQQHMRHHFPNTMTFQFTNFPRPILESFIGSLNAMGTGLGGPDVFLEEPGLHYNKNPKGVYNYYPKLSGIIPLTPSVMTGNYKNTKADGTGYEPTVRELLDFARDKLKANYIFWTRNTDYSYKVLEMLNSKAHKSTPFGGLDGTCPSTFSSCID